MTSTQLKFALATAARRLAILGAIVWIASVANVLAAI